MKKTLFFILFPILSFTQTQIGGDIDGKFVPVSTSSTTFGASFSLSSDGSTLAIGDSNYATWSGAVWVYKNIAGTWTKLGNDIPKGYSGDEKGESVSLSSDGTILAVGSTGGWGSGRDSGIVQVYQNIAGIWTQIGADINGEFASDYSGTSVSLSSDGTTLAIGAPGNKNNQNIFQSGSVRVYKNISGTWTKIGADIDGVDAADNLGFRISLSSDGSTLAIGTYEDYVRVYKNIAGTWTLLGNEISGNYYCLSLSGDGSTMAVSTSSYTYIYDGTHYNRVDTSYVKVLSISNGVWTQLGANIYKNEGCCAPYTDYSVSLSNDGLILAVGFPGVDENGNENGTVRIYKKIHGNWTQQGVDIKGEANYDKNGTYVSLSKDGATIAIGAPNNDGNGLNSGSVRVYNLSAVLSSDSFVMANFAVYPNPAYDVVKINLQEDLTLEKVNIYNTLGQLVKTEKSNIISVTSLLNGTYYFEIITDKGKGTKTVLVK